MHVSNKSAVLQTREHACMGVERSSGFVDPYMLHCYCLPFIDELYKPGCMFYEKHFDFCE